MENEDIKAKEYPTPENEKFDLTYEGLLANKEYLIKQRESGNPNYKYKGNCTKKFTEAVIDRYFDSMWSHVKSIPLPSRNEFPITARMMENELKNLVKKDGSWKTRSPIIRYFHNETFNNSNRNGCLSPNDFWKKLQTDEKLFREFYHNRLRCSDWFNENDKTGKYEDNRHYLIEGFVPDFIFSIGLDTSRKAPLVSYFKPSLAKYLVKKYLNDLSEVYDPFSGMSGRLLGTLATGKKYIGRDLNDIAISESKALMTFAGPILDNMGLTPQWFLEKADATTATGEYESVLMCSPYAKSEIWANGTISSEKTCDDWLDTITTNIKAKRYVAVVDGNIEKYKPYVKETLENTSHFGSNVEYVVVIERN